MSTFVLSPECSLDGNIDDECFLGNTLSHLDESRAKRFPHLSRAFADYVDQFGPNDYFVLQKSLKEDLPNPPLRTVVSLLKLGDWDPDVFFKFRDTILNHAPSCGIKLRNDLCRGVPRVWANNYMMDMDKDIAFEIGRFYYGIRDYERALFYYKESTATVGEHHVTYHNQGLCHYSLNQPETALTLFQKALSMNANYEKARSWIEKVETDLKMRQKTAELVAQNEKEKDDEQPAQQSSSSTSTEEDVSRLVQNVTI